MNWEDRFQDWSRGPSTTESTKADNAEGVVCDILRTDPGLSKMDIRVCAQGSYKNRTNVRLNSDVDICVLHRDVLLIDVPPNTIREQFGLTASDIHYSDLKNKVGQVLVTAFGTSGVTRGNKAFDVHTNSYRVDADVVPAFAYRRYTGDGDNHHKDIAFDSASTRRDASRWNYDCK